MVTENKKKRFIRISKVMEYGFENPDDKVATPYSFEVSYINLDKMVGVNMTESIFIPKDCVELVFPGENFIISREEFEEKIKPHILL